MYFTFDDGAGIYIEIADMDSMAAAEEVLSLAQQSLDLTRITQINDRDVVMGLEQGSYRAYYIIDNFIVVGVKYYPPFLEEQTAVADLEEFVGDLVSP